MKQIYYIIMYALLAIAFTACQDDTPEIIPYYL